MQQEKKKLNDKERMELVLRSFNVNANTFATSIGLERPDRIYYVLKERNGISKQLAEMITARYNMISYVWLSTGEGEPFLSNIDNDTVSDISDIMAELKVTPVQLVEMVGMQYSGEIMDALKGMTPSLQLQKKIRALSKKKGVPFLNLTDIKGSIEESMDTYKGTYYNIPINQVDCIIASNADLDSKDIKTGDLLTIRKVQETFVQLKRAYVIDTPQGQIVCEIVGDKGDDVEVKVADDARFSIPKSSIIATYIVVSATRPK